MATVKTVNDIGLNEIARFLKENHKKGDLISSSPSMVRHWAVQADDQLDYGNSASIEIRSFDSIYGRTQEFTVSDAGIDTNQIEDDQS